MPLTLNRLDRANPAHVAALQAVLEAAPRYHVNTGGAAAGPAEAEGTLAALPPGHGYDTKFVYGLARGERLVGCADVIRGYPGKETAMIGLLLLREDEQGRGAGREAVRALEAEIRGWPEIRGMRIGVVAANGEVLGFWKRMGFAETGARRPYEQGSVRSETILLEKPLTRA